MKAVYARRIARDVLPKAAAELARWRRFVEAIPNPELRRQARASITKKRFHAEGGSVYAALAPQWLDTLVPLIVALQTISDYLDNLCDRSVSLNEADFRTLHRAMLDAVDGSAPGRLNCSEPRAVDGAAPHAGGAPAPATVDGAARAGDAPAPGAAPYAGLAATAVSAGSSYYSLHPNKDDGGYLAALVAQCRRCTARLPAYAVVRPYVRRLVGLYNDLQVYKHGPLAGRVPALERWFAGQTAAGGQRTADEPWRPVLTTHLHWWEFAAAAGSTLGVFALFTAATNPNLTASDAERIVDAYFPWICGLHILLDYLIDQEEDAAGGDLNLVSFYPDGAAMRRRLTMFVREARRRARTLPDAAFHTSIVQGLPGLYLSDAKVHRQRMERLALRLLQAGGPASFAYYLWCRWRRFAHTADA
ncbi:MAG: tetraprenyl-beta-curcumene synthase family protein [Limnochordales bacterium]